METNEPMKKAKETRTSDPFETANNEEETAAAEIKNMGRQNMKKSKVIFLGMVIGILIALGVCAGIWIAGMQSGSVNPDGASPYSAVYLSTGDIYFGKLSWFPSPHMTDVWFIQRSQDQSGQPQVGVASMQSVFWGPVDEINFNSKDIVFWTRLKNSSQLVQALSNPASATGQQGETGSGATAVAPGNLQQQPSEPSATSTR